MSAVASTAVRSDERRLLRHVSGDGAHVGLAEHRARYGRAPIPGRRPRRELIDVAAAAGLRGRGGAGFPTARKLAAVAGGRGPRIVAVNATEGEPASSKDRTLLTHVPHLVLDGALVAATAAGAERIVVAVDRADRPAVRMLRAALAERRAAGETTDIEIAETPTRYVAGEESALVRYLNGGDAKPQAARRRPFEEGVDGRPTLIQNAETLAHLAQITRFGPEWFRGTGTADEPGTTLVTVTGAVAHPAVVEVPVGTRVEDILTRAGGPDRADRGAARRRLLGHLDSRLRRPGGSVQPRRPASAWRRPGRRDPRRARRRQLRPARDRAHPALVRRRERRAVRPVRLRSCRHRPHRRGAGCRPRLDRRRRADGALGRPDRAAGRVWPSRRRGAPCAKRAAGVRGRHAPARRRDAVPRGTRPGPCDRPRHRGGLEVTA